ncbi:unnamed protein product [Adineta ricciae]|uniref:Uncharacterized protein n=1 Tax=Adineta ricciae TaxID=249248 RepID=A0A813TVJ1_ADIRI|nr:unnamed protein product [Adineta ricciae]CAF1319845.1 unnamed protein product [Adineta ricciae]
MFSNGTMNITVYNPMESDYKKLMTLYSTSFQCPCNNISVQYKSFLRVDAIFHEICSSDFVQAEWRDYLFDQGNWLDHYRVDTTVQHAIDQFLNETFINTQLIPRSEFQLRINISNFILQSQQITTAQFSRSVDLLHNVMDGNGLISSYLLNYKWSIDLNRTYTTIPISSVTMKTGCSCGTRTDCIESGGIYYDRTNSQVFATPG